MNEIPLSKRYSTWCNLITIISGAAMPFMPELIPHAYQGWVLMLLAVTTALAQAIKQGKLDEPEIDDDPSGDSGEF